MSKLKTYGGPLALAAVLVLGLTAVPVAGAAGEGSEVEMGERNPSRGTVGKETQIIAKTGVNTYGTRQSNLGTGGGAIYGCRSLLGANPFDPKLSTPCVRVNNLANGEAFQFVSNGGTVVGVIQAGPAFTTPNPNAAPFITNATGLATGLNADKLDGRDAEQIIAEARAGNPAATAPSFAFARVLVDGKVDASRSQGVTDANIEKKQTGVYCFKGLSSRPKNVQATLDNAPGEIASDVTANSDAACPDSGNNVEAIVRTYNSAGAPEDRGFQIAITGGGA